MGLGNYLDWVALGIFIVCYIQMGVFSFKSMEYVAMEEKFQLCIKSFFVCGTLGLFAIGWLLIRHLMI